MVGLAERDRGPWFTRWLNLPGPSMYAKRTPMLAGPWEPLSEKLPFGWTKSVRTIGESLVSDSIPQRNFQPTVWFQPWLPSGAISGFRPPAAAFLASICLRLFFIFPCWFEKESITTGKICIFVPGVLTKCMSGVPGRSRVLGGRGIQSQP